MKAEIIAVGSELLTPDRMDTNSLFLTEELNKLGIEVVRKTIVGDDRDLLRETLTQLLLGGFEDVDAAWRAVTAPAVVQGDIEEVASCL